MTVFEWVRKRLSNIYAISEKALEPAQMLLEAGAPKDFSTIFSGLEDAEYPLKSAFDGDIPDLESRTRVAKRTKGQFYTPETLAEKMLAQVVENKGELLDPACGDGSFLLAAGKYFPLSYLYGFDIDLYALLICAVRLVTVYPNQGWPNLEQRDFLLQRPKRKYSVIVGNPPYKVNLDAEYKKALELLYKTSEGEKDLYTFFFEAGLMCLKEDGILSMVTSHTWLVNHQCLKIRELIFNNTRVKSLSMLPPRFFAFAPTILGVVLTTKNIIPSEEYRVEVFSDYSEEKGWISKFSTKSSSLIRGTGLREGLIPEKLKEVFTEMESSSGVCLGSVCRIGLGIQESVKKTGIVSQYIFDEAKDENYKPVLRGREIEAFKINWEKKYIYFGSHLAYAGKEEIYRSPKILYQNIRNEKLKIRLVSTIDRDGFYFKNSLSYIVSEDDNYSLELLTGLLNSDLVNCWFAGKNHSFHITVTQVRQIPLPPFNRIIFEKIEKIVKKLLKADEKVSKDRLRKALNKAVNESYLINPDKISQNELEDFLTRAAGL